MMPTVAASARNMLRYIGDPTKKRSIVVSLAARAALCVVWKERVQPAKTGLAFQERDCSHRADGQGHRKTGFA
jgi:hypothetical protein